MDLKELGFTKDELQKRVVDKCVESLLTGVGWDEGGDEGSIDSALSKKLAATVKRRIDEAVEKMATKHILPGVTKYIETLCLEETNRWGEKKGTKLTFIEYLVARADFWMREEVSFQGKTKDEDSYSWKASGTRIAHMVHQHLHYSIESAMKKALDNANSTIKGGLEAAVKIALENAQKALKVEVKTA